MHDCTIIRICLVPIHFYTTEITPLFSVFSYGLTGRENGLLSTRVRKSSTPVIYFHQIPFTEINWGFFFSFSNVRPFNNACACMHAQHQSRTSVFIWKDLCETVKKKKTSSLSRCLVCRIIERFERSDIIDGTLVIQISKEQ